MKKGSCILFLLFSIQIAYAQLSLRHKSVIDSKVVTVKPKSANSKSLDSLNIIRSNILGYYDIAVPNNIDVKKYVSLLKETGDFETVEFNYLTYINKATEETYLKQIISNSLDTMPCNKIVRNSGFPNDPNYYQQVLLEKINVPNAWNITTGSPSVKVAIIDTGIDSTHVDLGVGYDGFSNISSTIGINCDLWLNSHGTEVAGIIGAKTNNGVGMAGIAGGNNSYGATLVPYYVYHFLDPDLINWSLVDDYIVDATIDGVNIICIGYMVEETNYAMSSAINYANNHGVTIICGTGDYSILPGEKPIVYPAANDKVIAVGACEFYSQAGEDYRYCEFSAYGPEIDIVAPGYLAYTTVFNQSYTHLATGTHIAAAHVAGVVALMLSVNTQLTPAHVRQILRDTAIKSSYYSYTNGFNQFVGYGLVDAFAAVEMAPYYISGNNTLCQSDVYYVVGLPTGATVTWTLSGSNASKYNLVQNSPSTNKCTITKKANAVFSSSSFNLTLTANIYQGGTLIKTKTKTLTCNNGFACTYQQAAHSSYGINYPAITETQMTSATNYVYPGGTVSLQSNYFRGKEITASGTYDQFHHIYNQNVVTFSLPPYTSNPLIINVPASGCDDAVQLTFYPMSYYSMGSYSATLSVVSEQEYRISLVRNEEESAEDTVDATRTIAENSENDGKVSWTVEAVNALTGRKVLSTEPQGTDYVLSTAGWESGLYVLRVIVGGEVVATQKIHVK